MPPKRKERSTKLSRTAQTARARRSVVIAGHRGDVETARAALSAADPALRVTALGALARLGRTTVADVETAATDQDAAVRANAASIAFGLAPTDAIPLVETLLGDPDSSVVEAAAFTAGELAGDATRLIPGVAALMDHEDAIVRETAVAALGAIGHPSALATILAATEDRATVRRRAVIALAPFDGPEVDRALRTALDDRDWQVRQAAEDQLAIIEDAPRTDREDSETDG